MTNVANQLQRAAEKVLIGEQRAEDYDNGDEVRCPQGSDQTEGLMGSYNEYHRIMSIPGRVLHVTRSEARNRCCQSRVTHQVRKPMGRSCLSLLCVRCTGRLRKTLPMLLCRSI